MLLRQVDWQAVVRQLQLQHRWLETRNALLSLHREFEHKAQLTDSQRNILKRCGSHDDECQ